MMFQKTRLEGSFLIDIEARADDRGFFARCFCEKEFARVGLNTHWVQVNNSMSSKKGTLRGLHFQRPPHAEAKLIRCLKGSVWDVVVDLREGSKTFGEWFGSTLSDQNRTMMYVPEGFAHGYISLEQHSEILYLVSSTYTPAAEGTLIWNDPEVGIKWPMEPVVISEKDMSGNALKNIPHIDLES